jgi:hypothetical protein
VGQDGKPIKDKKVKENFIKQYGKEYGRDNLGYYFNRK